MSRSGEAEHRFQKRCVSQLTATQIRGGVVVVWPNRISSEHKKGEATRMVINALSKKGVGRNRFLLLF